MLMFVHSKPSLSSMVKTCQLVLCFEYWFCQTEPLGLMSQCFRDTFKTQKQNLMISKKHLDYRRGGIASESIPKFHNIFYLYFFFQGLKYDVFFLLPHPPKNTIKIHPNFSAVIINKTYQWKQYLWGIRCCRDCHCPRRQYSRAALPGYQPSCCTIVSVGWLSNLIFTTNIFCSPFMKKNPQVKYLMLKVLTECLSCS